MHHSLVLTTWPRKILASVAIAAGFVCIAVEALPQEESKPATPPAVAPIANPSGVFQPSPSSAPIILSKPELPSAHDNIVDESALRYYAEQGQTERVKAEIRRLQKLYPKWSVPSDIDTIKPSPPEEAALWDLFTAGEFDELRKAITARRSNDPGWTVSFDLMRKLNSVTFRREILALSARSAWQEIVTRIKNDGTSVQTVDIDVAWLIAEAYAQTGQTDAAAAAYRDILDSHEEPALRIATIQKAMANLPFGKVEPLIQFVSSTKNGTKVLQSIRYDITLARLVGALHNEPVKPVDASDLAAIGDDIRKQNDVKLMSLVGWYEFKRHQYRDALEWFRAAIAHGDDPVLANGLALTLSAMGENREAEQIAFASHASSIDNAVLYVDIMRRQLAQYKLFIDSARLQNFATFVVEAHSGEGAEALAWRAYNSCQYDVALDWFARAAAWHPKQSSILGLALSLRPLKKTKEYYEVVNRYDGLFPQVVDLVFNLEPRRGSPPSCAIESSSALKVASRIPAPVASTQRGTIPTEKKGQFPIAVDSANPFRFAPSQYDRARDAEFLQDLPKDPQPLVARRVVGVAPMPYEKLGYALQPPWNGSDASVAQASLTPPLGTLDHAAAYETDVELSDHPDWGDVDRFGSFDGTGTRPAVRAPSE